MIIIVYYVNVIIKFICYVLVKSQYPETFVEDEIGQSLENMKTPSQMSHKCNKDKLRKTNLRIFRAF